MTRWRDRAERLCYDGETIRERVPVGEDGVVVTTHRVLVFRPTADGANYRAVDRPNVVGVRRTASGDGRFLEPGAKAAVAGLAMLGAGQVISLDDLVGSVSLSGTGQLGLGGVLGLVQSMLALVARIDEILTAFGLLALAFGAVVLAVYAWSREDLLTVEVAGGEDVTLPASSESGVADRLGRAIEPDPVSDADGAGAGADDATLP